MAWNLLWGFPGETERDYADQAAVVPDLVHLQPPASADRIWLERFSPLFAAQRSPTPEASYRYVYPPSVDLPRAAYFFDWPPGSGLPPSAYAPLSREVTRWQSRWRETPRPSLTHRCVPGLLRIEDRRPGREGTYTFPDPVAAVYLACDERPRSAAAVAAALAVPEPAVRQTFTEFARRGLMFLDGDTALALALPAIPGR